MAGMEPTSSISSRGGPVLDRLLYSPLEETTNLLYFFPSQNVDFLCTKKFPNTLSPHSLSEILKNFRLRRTFWVQHF